MIKEAIDRIVSLALAGKKPEIIEVDGRKYSNIGLNPVMEPMPEKLAVSTLSAMVDYCNADDNADYKVCGPDSTFVIVTDCENVSAVSNLTGKFMQRSTFLEASFDFRGFPFDQFIDVETFIIKLQSMFVTNDDLKKVLALVGNLREDNIKNVSDDGVTQTVTAKTGIARVSDTPVPNPVILAPFRTFPEIEQPESLFVFRMKQGGPHGPLCALFEADGGYWQVVAIQRIKEWLQERLPEHLILA